MKITNNEKFDLSALSRVQTKRRLSIQLSNQLVSLNQDLFNADEIIMIKCEVQADSTRFTKLFFDDCSFLNCQLVNSNQIIVKQNKQSTPQFQAEELIVHNSEIQLFNQKTVEAVDSKITISENNSIISFIATNCQLFKFNSLQLKNYNGSYTIANMNMKEPLKMLFKNSFKQKGKTKIKQRSLKKSTLCLLKQIAKNQCLPKQLECYKFWHNT
ncbi:Hypothetical_protein [Hexamita inflata]|uniref:Hypothetical_protein n=1 Tax=Hexamita inflata TaxID=28002 RepID=A0AA86TMF9_9EUKA|nr:Hypothetical protein HINF_LOCUS10664 [Hexamita inflata]